MFEEFLRQVENILKRYEEGSISAEEAYEFIHTRAIEVRMVREKEADGSPV